MKLNFLLVADLINMLDRTKLLFSISMSNPD
jgi:hypothetical protein